MRSHWVWAGLVILAGLASVGAALRVAADHHGPPTLTLGGDLPARGRVLWLQGHVGVTGDEAVALRDSTGRVLLIDNRLHVREPTLPGAIGSVVSAAPARDGALWIVDGTGGLLNVTAEGRVVAKLETPFRLPALGGVGDDGRLTLVRSPEGFPFALDTVPAAPVALLDTSGRVVRMYGEATRPAHVLLTDLANSGYVARAGTRTFFAPFVRDEVIAFGTAGDTVWTLRRGLDYETPEPRFELRSGSPVLNFFPVNLGIGLGPDRRLYVLSTADTTLGRSRLDVLDPADGRPLATFFLPTTLPTIVVTPTGRIHVIDAGRLLARAEHAERASVPPFDWPKAEGGRVTQAALRGRVTIVNAWASWCAPCREEMPELVALWTSLRDSGLALLTINEDLKPDAARRWLAERRLAPPVALAAGGGRGVFHYPGLPYTILVDGNGEIARRWIGYAGPHQIADVAAAARGELGLALPAHATGAHEHVAQR